jgi:disulfide oxidoreductase YuzD
MVDFNITPIWRRIKIDLLHGKSILVSAPKSFGKTRFLTNLRHDESIQKKFDKTVYIHFDNGEAKRINYGKIWSRFLSKEEQASRSSVRTKADFISAVSELINAVQILIIMECDYRTKHLIIDLINGFQELFHSSSSSVQEKIALLVADDLSLYFYERIPQSNYSLWDIFHSKVYVSPLTDARTINGSLINLPFSECTDLIGKALFEMTGGHHGLIYSALNYLVDHEVDCRSDGWEKDCRNYLGTTQLMNLISQIILKLDLDYLEIALSFKSERLSDNLIDPGVIQLHEAGIVLLNGICSQLCPGIITELIEQAYAKRAAQKNVANSLKVHNHEIVTNEVMTLIVQDRREQEEFVSRVRNLTMKNEMEVLFGMVEKFVYKYPDKPFSDTLMLITGRYHELERSKMQNTISQDDYSLGIGKIRNAILSALKYI